MRRRKCTTDTVSELVCEFMFWFGSEALQVETLSLLNHPSTTNRTSRMMKIPTILHNLFPSRNNSSSSIVIDGPTDNDVLCGRDRNFCKHPGNLLYRVHVERQASAYALATTKQGKMKITKSIVHAMQSQYGSRFLRRTEANQWEVLTNVQARDKTSHALRFINNSNSSYSSQRTDEDSSEQIESKDSSNPSDESHEVQHPSYRVQCKNGDEKSVVVPSLTKSCSHATVDESTIAAIHLRQQELLRASLQNDRMMDVQNNDGQALALEQLLTNPMFTMSSFGAGTTHQNSNINHFGSVAISDMRSVGGDSMMFSLDDSFNNSYRHHPAPTNVFTRPVGSFTIPSVCDDVDEQQRFDSIRTMDMVDLILNRPVDDTLRSEELNFLLNDSVMDETF